MTFAFTSTAAPTGGDAGGAACDTGFAHPKLLDAKTNRTTGNDSIRFMFRPLRMRYEWLRHMPANAVTGGPSGREAWDFDSFTSLIPRETPAGSEGDEMTLASGARWRQEVAPGLCALEQFPDVDIGRPGRFPQARAPFREVTQPGALRIVGRHRHGARAANARWIPTPIGIPVAGHSEADVEAARTRRHIRPGHEKRKKVPRMVPREGTAWGPVL